jgi:hypothetical protein
VQLGLVLIQDAEPPGPRLGHQLLDTGRPVEAAHGLLGQPRAQA